MSQINKIQFGGPLMSCNPTLLSDENKNPGNTFFYKNMNKLNKLIHTYISYFLETSRLAVLENKVTLLNSKYFLLQFFYTY